MLRVGYEISAPLVALGLPSCEQALRVVKFHLTRSIYGNRFIELETSVKGLGIRPGDLITVTYSKEGLTRAPFRVLSIQPSFDYQTVLIQAQKHEDGWYDALGSPSGARSNDPRKGGAEGGVPRPLVPTEIGGTDNRDSALSRKRSLEPTGAARLSFTFRSRHPMHHRKKRGADRK